MALNQQTGAVSWQVQVGTPGQDTAANGAATPWTLYYRGLVLVGTENGGGSGMRGHIYALQRAADGSRGLELRSDGRARASPGHGSWAGNSWQLGGGDVWMPPAIDPRLGLIYLTLANPEPQDRRSGAGRVTTCTRTRWWRCRWNTGKLIWHFQSVHHDLWDYDNEMAPVIANVRYRSGVRKVVIYGSKTAWLYYLNARTGKPVVPVHEKKVPVLTELASLPHSADTWLVTRLSRLARSKTGSHQTGAWLSDAAASSPRSADKPVIVTPGPGRRRATGRCCRSTGRLVCSTSRRPKSNAAFSNGLPYGQPTFWSPAGELRGGVLDAIDPRTNTIVWQTHDQGRAGERRRNR